jgi:F420-non-reducing hydrogenase iron-sulfur subunit
MSTVREIDTETIPEETEAQAPPVTVFVCANCARPGKESTSAGRPRPAVPDFNWPFPVDRIVVPCAGRIQPEHVLKTFEAGADLVSIIACEGDNCHYIEGSARCTRRVEFIRSIIEEIGLGGERLLLAFLPGSAAEDLLADSGKPAQAANSDSLAARIISVREETVRTLKILPKNPLRPADADEVPGKNIREGLDITDDNKDQ